MCIYVTAIVPNDALTSALIKTCEKYCFSVEKMNNESLATLVPNSVQFLPLGGVCNCDTALGSSVKHCAGKHEDIDREVTKLKKKGWNAAKIERWKVESERTAARLDQQRGKKLQEELARWSGLIDELFTTLAYYRGLVDQEHLSVGRIEHVQFANATTEYLAHLDSDVIYQFISQ